MDLGRISSFLQQQNQQPFRTITTPCAVPSEPDPHLGPWDDMGWLSSTPPGTHAVRMLGMASPLLLPFPQEQREQNEHQKRWCHAREPIPPPFPWDTLVHMDMDPSQLHHQHQNKIILSDLLWMSREARGLECGCGQCGQRWGPGSTKQMVHTGSGVRQVWQLLLRCFELVARLE